MEVDKGKMMAVVAAVVMAAALGVVATVAQPDLSCVEGLVPCVPYLNSTATPPNSCCVPLKQEAAVNLPCLCTILNTPDLLMAANTNITQVLDLAAACGITSLYLCSAPAPAPSMMPPAGSPGF